MTRAQRPVFLFLLASYAVSVFWGYSVGRKTRYGAFPDFEGVYYGTRCILSGCDPYNENQLYTLFRQESGVQAPSSLAAVKTVTQFVNLPPSFLLVAPFALLPPKLASLLWLSVIVISLGVAAYLMWDASVTLSPGLATFLVWLIAINCEVIAGAGNTAGIVVAACIVAVWCFVHERFTQIGILCLAVSLVVKPHDSGIVWLYFLLAGGLYRKRALQTLALTSIFAAIAFVWVAHATPHWWPEFRSNMHAIAAPGGLNDQGPASVTGRAVSVIIDLESAIRMVSNNPRIYNPANYGICSLLCVIWFIITLRSRPSPEITWLALAPAIPLTMLVAYHRPSDAKLLLLTIPACAILWRKGGAIAWLALLFTSAGIVFTGDIFLAMFLALTGEIRVVGSGVGARLLAAFLERPASFALLAMTVFYLWIYAQRSLMQRKKASGDLVEEAPARV